MTGTILELYDNNSGKILGDDEKQYKLLLENWKDSELPKKHKRVRFDLSEENDYIKNIIYLKDRVEKKGWFSKISLFWKTILFFAVLWVFAEIVAYYNTKNVQESKSEKLKVEVHYKKENTIAFNIKHAKDDILKNRDMNIEKLFLKIDKIVTNINDNDNIKSSLVHEEYRKRITKHALVIDQYATYQTDPKQYTKILEKIYNNLENDSLIMRSKNILFKQDDINDKLNIDEIKYMMKNKYQKLFIDVSTHIQKIYINTGDK